MTISALMPETRTWEKQGVTITYLCFENTLSIIVQAAMREAYLYDSPTESDSQAKAVPTTVFAFYKAMPLILKVDLADGAPRWGHFLKSKVESAKWLRDPIADYENIIRMGDSTILFDCYDGYLATREQAFAAPIELQSPEPLPPDPDPETGVIPEEKLNFTESSMSDGGTSSAVKVLPGQGKRSTAPRQKAT